MVKLLEWPTNAAAIAELMKVALESELWLVEASDKRYQENPPPPGCFAMRTHLRRRFFQLDNGRVPPPEEIERRMVAGDFIEISL